MVYIPKRPKVFFSKGASAEEVKKQAQEAEARYQEHVARYRRGYQGHQFFDNLMGQEEAPYVLSAGPAALTPFQLGKSIDKVLRLSGYEEVNDDFLKPSTGQSDKDAAFVDSLVHSLKKKVDEDGFRNHETRALALRIVAGDVTMSELRGLEAEYPTAPDQNSGGSSSARTTGYSRTSDGSSRVDGNSQAASRATDSYGTVGQTQNLYQRMRSS